MNRKHWIKTIILAIAGVATSAFSKPKITRVKTAKLCAYGFVGERGMLCAAKAFSGALKEAGVNAEFEWVNDPPDRISNPDGTIGSFHITVTK